MKTIFDQSGLSAKGLVKDKYGLEYFSDTCSFYEHDTMFVFYQNLTNGSDKLQSIRSFIPSNAMDFGEANPVLSIKLKKSIIQCASNINEGRLYEFRKKTTKVRRDGQVTEYWVCLECERIMKRDERNPNEQSCQITVRDQRITKDPDIGHHTLCTGKSFGEANAQNLNREAREQCKIGTKRPLETHTSMNSEVTKRFRNVEQAEQVEENLQAHKSMRSSLRQWSWKGRLPVDNVYNLPIEYQVTERGRFAEEESPFYHERWLLCSDPEQMTVAFMSDQDISVTFESGHLIMDGTFKISPDGFAQLYTIHSWGAFEFEAVPVCHALMSRKTADSYTYLLTNIRNRLMELHNGIGAFRFVHMDFEMAAYNAVQQVFPEVSIKGCNFHFSQALNRKLQQLGLRDLWNNNGEIGEWIGCLKALAMLPTCLIRGSFETILSNPPNSGDQLQNRKLETFRDYFRETWVNGHFPLSMWSQWDNPGPRTTNHAEGYHNRLNLAEVRDMHLAVRNFLHLLQPMHNRDQIRVRNLRRGIYVPKPRDATYVDLDNRIQNSRNLFVQITGNIWQIDNFDINNLQVDIFEFLMRQVHHFLRYMRHLIGKKSRLVFNNDF